MSPPAKSETPSSSLVRKYKYHLLIGIYTTVTSLLFYRVHRQPFALAIKSEQYETIFKGTTLAAVIGGIAMSNTGHWLRSARFREFFSASASESTN
ncbi:hypothetical protein F4775DRAFT_595432 [Biscogniauxia sp. FL1348]|nr:hypothetical protein F4775DRAFT_595432 [Biscogniauxia sp. FL1348]